MLDNREVLGLGLELLIGIDAGAEHLGRRAHPSHLLSHLACSCHKLSILESKVIKELTTLTIITAEQEVKDGLKTEDTEKVPADAGHPSGIHILGHDACLKHALELDSQRERQFH